MSVHRDGEYAGGMFNLVHKMKPVICRVGISFGSFTLVLRVVSPGVEEEFDGLELKQQAIFTCAVEGYSRKLRLRVQSMHLSNWISYPIIFH